MKKFNSIFKFLVNILLVMLLIIIFINCLLSNNSLIFLSDPSDGLLFMILISFLLVFFVHLLFTKIDKTKNTRIIRIVSMLFIVLIQILLISCFDIQQPTDSYFVEDHAYSVASGLTSKVNNSVDKYFDGHVNNNFYLVLNIFLIKIIRCIKILKINVGLELFALLCIDISLILTYKLAKELLDEKTATKILVLNVLNPLNYYMVFWTYTCTYSIPFVVGLLYLAVKIRKQDGIGKNIFYSICFSLVTIICYFLRPIILIPLIAIIMCFVLYKEKGNWKKYLMTLGIFVFVCLGVGTLIKSSFNHYITREENVELPVTHYIMMGLHGKGVWNKEDPAYSKSFGTTDKMKEANIKEIKRTLKGYKVSGFIKHLIIKLPVSWSSGDSKIYRTIEQDRNSTNRLNKWIIGEKRDLIITYCNAYRLVIILFAIFGTVTIIKDKKYDKLFIVTLTLFGAILFYLLWEAKGIYSYPFLTLLGLISCIGLCGKYNRIDKVKKNTFIFTSVMICVILFAFKFDLTMHKTRISDYRIKTSSASNVGHVDNIIKKDIKVTQGFRTNDKFNRVALHVSKTDENDNNYVIKIYKKDDLIEKYNVSYEDIDSESDYIILTMPINTGKPGNYKIEISSDDKNKSDEDNLSWKYISSNGLDNYKGKLNINNKNNLGDLSIKVYSEYKDRYMNAKAFLLLYILAIMIVFFEYRNIYNKEK